MSGKISLNIPSRISPGCSTIFPRAFKKLVLDLLRHYCINFVFIIIIFRNLYRWFSSRVWSPPPTKLTAVWRRWRCAGASRPLVDFRHWCMNGFWMGYPLNCYISQPYFNSISWICGHLIILNYSIISNIQTLLSAFRRTACGNCISHQVFPQTPENGMRKMNYSNLIIKYVLSSLDLCDPFSGATAGASSSFWWRSPAGTSAARH